MKEPDEWKDIDYEEEKNFKKVDDVTAARKKFEKDIGNLKSFLSDRNGWNEIVEARKKLEQEVGSISSYLRQRALERGEDPDQAPLPALEPTASVLLRRPRSHPSPNLGRAAKAVPPKPPRKPARFLAPKSEPEEKAEPKVSSSKELESKLDKDLDEKSRRKAQDARQNLLLYDAWEGRVTSLQRYHKEGSSMNFHDKDHRTPLHLAAMRGHIKTVKFLLREARADPTQEDRHGYQSLDYAFTHGSMNVLHYIVREQRAGFPLGWKRQEMIKITKVLDSYQPGIDLDSARFIAREQFLECGEIPSFERCQEEHLHISGFDMDDFSTVLFISCQWDRSEASENFTYYKMITDFLGQEEGCGVQCVWIAHACLPNLQRCSDALGMLLGNFTSSHFLILPKLSLVKSVRSRDPDGNPITGIGSYRDHLVTDLDLYLHSGWHQFQLITSLVLGCKVICCYCLRKNTGDDIILEFIHVEGAWIERDDYEERKLSSFQHAAMDLKVNGNLWYGFLKDKWYWGIKEPMDILTSSAKCLMDLLTNRSDLVDIIMRMELSEEEANTHNFIDKKTSEDLCLVKISEMLGHFPSEQERLYALQLIITFLFYLMRHDNFVEKLNLHFKEEQKYQRQESSISETTTEVSQDSINDVLHLNRPISCSFIDINRRNKKLPKTRSSPRPIIETKAKRTGGGFSLASRWGSGTRMI